MSTLHVFDMDGTLLHGTSASLEIARQLGCLAEVVALERAFAACAVDTVGFAADVHRLWQALDTATVRRVFDAAPWIGGMREVFTDIRQRGEATLVVTMSPDFFADLLLGAGADHVVASRFPPLPLRRALDPAGILRPVDKVTVVDRVRARYGLGRDACVAYGDSLSDEPLFAAVRHTVAVNADERLRALARLRYDGADLREAYQQVRDLLAAGRRPGEPRPRRRTGAAGR